MDLREFIKETLLQINMGVQDAITAHRALPDAVGVINPVWGADASAITAEHAQKVQFDVAVTVTDKNSQGGKAGIKVLNFLDVSGEAGKAFEQSSVSRIKFAIPIVPAVQIVTGKTE
jgi:hypothetical protein